MKIILATTGQPSTNPRLVKEADALVEAGYSVKVYYAFWAAWAEKTDIEIFKNVKWEHEQIGGSPNSDAVTFFLNKIKSKFYHKISKHLNLFLERSRNRAYHQLIKALKKEKADHYIAHNLGALAPAAFAAKYHNASFSFDAEDFHRGQYDNLCRDREIDILIEDRYISNAKFVTTASPLITKHYQDLYPKLNLTLINNVFKIQKNIFNNGVKETCKQPLKLFWFSQTIGTNRGIETVIEAMGLIPSKNVQLTLLGSIDDQHMQYFKNLVKHFGLLDNQFCILDPVPPAEIFKIAKLHDVGLALEPAFNFNNDIALSNKIFTYLSVGLTIIASETQAQKKFLNENPTAGFTFEIGNAVDLSNIIQQYVDNRDFLERQKSNTLQLATTKFNWELESQKFISLVDSMLKK